MPATDQRYCVATTRGLPTQHQVVTVNIFKLQFSSRDTPSKIRSKGTENMNFTFEHCFHSTRTHKKELTDWNLTCRTCLLDVLLRHCSHRRWRCRRAHARHHRCHRRCRRRRALRRRSGRRFVARRSCRRNRRWHQHRSTSCRCWRQKTIGELRIR